MRATSLVMAVAGLLTVVSGCSSPSPSQTKKDAPDERPEATGKAEEKPAPVDRPLFLFGIDGATWDIMDPLLEAGKLPNFARLIEAGTRAPLKTFEPTLSPLIWTTIGTGFAPHRHGIEGFTAPVAGSDETALVSSNMRKTAAIWNTLSKSGHSVGLVGWWATYPAEELDGFVISDQASTLRHENYREALGLGGGPPQGTDPRSTWPPDLAEELAAPLTLSPKVEPEVLDRFMKLPKGEREKIAAGEKVDKEDILSIFKFAYLIDRSFVEASLAAAKKKRPEVLIMYLNGLDAAEHHFWKYREPEKFSNVPAGEIERYRGVIDSYYVYMDEVLGEFLKLYPPGEAVTIVVSDHGHEANPEFDPSSEDHYDRVCSGGHEGAPDGVFILAGKDAKRGAKIEKPNVFDIAPTVLALMGTPIGSDMPGKVARDAVDPAFWARHPISEVDSHGPNPGYRPGAIPSGMNDALKEKLKGLGYIK